MSSEQRDYPPATDETICATCGERGHYWCRPSRVLFTGRGTPSFYPGDFEAETEVGIDAARHADERARRPTE